MTEFSKKTVRGKEGLQLRCKVCAAEDTRIWNLQNQQTRRDRYLKNKYNISENEYNAMLLSQNNSCIICGVEFSNVWGADAPVVDHCHTTGKVRGILCNECNRGLGYFHDNSISLENAILYLRNNNAISKKWGSSV